MEILRWQVGNTLKNYQYILYDTERNAVVIDPLDRAEIRKLIHTQNLYLRAILVTHEHNDHAAEAGPLQQEFGVPIYTSNHNTNLISAKTTGLPDTAYIPMTSELKIQLHATPGHTAGHAAFEANGFFFSGDCLFHGGCGHCRSRNSDVEEHYRTISDRLHKLSPDLILMPGHYYAARNLDFSLHVEPGNQRSQALRDRLKTDADELQHEMTLKQEKEYNPFMRLSNRALRARLEELTGRNMIEASDLVIFSELRSLRDGW